MAEDAETCRLAGMPNSEFAAARRARRDYGSKAGTYFDAVTLIFCCSARLRNSLLVGFACAHG